MEKEYKWSAAPSQFGDALLWASVRVGSPPRTIQMHSEYFDTADGLLRAHDAALRMRRENDKSVCCMKRKNVNSADGMRAHEEYECDAETITSGLAALPAHGAPAYLCALAAAAPLEVTCTVAFTRTAVLLQQEDTVCELALDEGRLCRADRTAPLCEIELEFKVGDEAVFHALANELSAQLSLTPEPKSKLARAIAL